MTNPNPSPIGMTGFEFNLKLSGDAWRYRTLLFATGLGHFLASLGEAIRENRAKRKTIRMAC